MGELGGFLKIERVGVPYDDPAERVRASHLQGVPRRSAPTRSCAAQGARCMECGVPFCHNGCPLGNLIPDWNDLVYRDRWQDAIRQLHATNNFPEFTGRLCPAPCEAACVLEIREGDAVTIKQIENSIIDRAWDEGWVVPAAAAARDRPQRRRRRRRPGGHGRRAAAAPRGPPRRALRARRGRRRPRALRRAGLQDREDRRRAPRRAARRRGRRAAPAASTSASTSPPRSCASSSTRSCWPSARACRATCRSRAASSTASTSRWTTSTCATAGSRRASGPTPRSAPRASTSSSSAAATPAPTASATRSARAPTSVVQLELLPEPPATRPDERTPWPLWPLKFRLCYAMEEAKAAGRGEQDFSVVDHRSFAGEDGRVHDAALRAGRSRRRRSGRSRAPRASSTPTSCCWRWASCIPSTTARVDQLGVEKDPRGNVKAADLRDVSVDGVFAAGDARRGQSLIVWAINEGRQCARMVDRYLGGLDAEPRARRRRRRRRGPRGPAAGRRALVAGAAAAWRVRAPAAL